MSNHYQRSLDKLLARGCFMEERVQKRGEGLLEELPALRRENQLYKCVLEQFPVCAIIYDRTGKVIYRNRMTRVIDGYDDGEMLGLTREQYLKKLEIKPGQQALIIAPGSGGSGFKNGLFGLSETTLRTKAGEVKDVLLIGSYLYGPEKQVLGAVGCCLDITEYVRRRREAEQRLRASEERFFKAFHNNPTPMAIVRFSDDCCLEVNESFERTFGYRREECIGRTVLDLGLLMDRETFAAYKALLWDKKRVHNMGLCLRNRKGNLRHVLLSGELMELDGQLCRLIAINDITELKKIEAEMARLDRLKLVGEMAASIGHEIRNPMTTVRGFLQLLSRQEEFANHRGHFRLMIEELDRANAIITEYLSLARGRSAARGSHNLNHIINALLPLLQAHASEWGHDLAVQMEPLPDLLLDEKEIRQLILNLVRNGLEAMGKSGLLYIKTFREGEEVALAVRDEGPGMAPGVLEKIGTPFFSTKENGTGLGLAVCYSIAARHDARLEIDTGPAGTTVRVRFKSNL
ncbi:MAG: PAS domain S-box protein [Desulfurispora sp.]|uniref:PAS domain S-box protein n=1 Tax=Desulfurispora sp. TaxID=3014275 RepID=UPI00404A6FD6